MQYFITLFIQGGSRSRKRQRDSLDGSSGNSTAKRSAMISLKEAPEITEEEREQILKMVAESEPEVLSH